MADPVVFGALVLLGAGAGFVSSLFGIGGGLVIVPFLVYLGNVPFTDATALSLLAIAFQSPIGVFQHSRRGAVHWRTAAFLAVGGAVGVLVGFWLEPALSKNDAAALKLLMACVMVVAAARLAWPRATRTEPSRGTTSLPGLAMTGVGAGAGTLSKLLGVGGGLVIVPVLAMTGTAMHVAVGSSLVCVFTNAALASAVKLGQGMAWLAAVPLAVGAIAAAPIGVRVAHGLKATVLARSFAGALVVAAVYIAATSHAF